MTHPIRFETPEGITHVVRIPVLREARKLPTYGGGGFRIIGKVFGDDRYANGLLIYTSAVSSEWIENIFVTYDGLYRVEWEGEIQRDYGDESDHPDTLV